jgi:hypothetical protein
MPHDTDFFAIKGDVEEMLQSFEVPSESAPTIFRSITIREDSGGSVIWRCLENCTDVCGTLQVQTARLSGGTRYRIADGWIYRPPRRGHSPIPCRETRFFVASGQGDPICRGAAHNYRRRGFGTCRVEPFDRLESGPFPETRYSLSVTVVYQSSERTLTDSEVDDFDKKILKHLEERLGAQLRK